MDNQDTENKENFFVNLFQKRGGSSNLSQMLFLGAGVLIIFSTFILLQVFIGGLVESERSRISEDVVEEIVEDFREFKQPLDTLSDMILLAETHDADVFRSMVDPNEPAFEAYNQVFWFHKPEGRNWTYADLWQTERINSDKLQPDSKLLSALLKKNILDTTEIQAVQEIGGFEQTKKRHIPRIYAKSFIIARAVERGNTSKGFVVAVIDMANFYKEDWIKLHRSLAFIQVKNVNDNAALFEFNRRPDEGELKDHRQVYEFPFAGHNWEISSFVMLDQRSQFLRYFPYIILVLGLCFTAAGVFYLRNNEKQSLALSKMNETLEQKNFELETEVSERERLNQVIADAEKKNRAVIDAVGDVIFETDRFGKIVFLNRAWQRLTGFDIEQAMGQDLFQMIHPDDQAAQKQAFQALLEGSNKEVRAYTQLRHSNGTFGAVELVLNMIRQNEGQDIRLIGTFTDIEERRRAERALSDAEKKYRNIVEHAAGGIFQLTPEGLYLSVNPAYARILGYDSAEQLLREVKNANDSVYLYAAERTALYGQLKTSKSIYNHETQMRRKDGSVIWVNENVRCVHDESGQLLFIEGSIEDITERKNSEEAIREAKINSDLANRAKSEFLSNMSHELRTPLNSIIGFSEMITSEVYGEIAQPEYREYAKDIHKSGNKLLQVINEILDISKIEAGERQLNEEILDMSEIVDSALELLDVKIDNTNMTITKAMQDLPKIVGEELALKQVIINLLSNAVKFTPDSGRITISGHVGKQGRFHLSITDTGIGLDEYEMKKALSPFGQVDSELKRSGSGTGLGLTLVDALVKLHGGEFELFSQKGIGTTATIILPSDRIVKKKKQAQVSQQVDQQPERNTVPPEDT